MMNSKFLLKTFLILFLVSMMLALVSAEEFDVQTYPVSYSFSSSIAPQTSVCQCSQTLIPITIINTGSYVTQFTIASDDNSVVLTQSKITLQPAEKRIIFAKKDVSCNSHNAEKINFDITSSFHFSKSISTILKSSNCHETKFAFDSVNLNEEICKPFNTTLFITNAGLLKENYTIKPSQGSVSLNAGFVQIPPKKTAKIIATYNLSCDIYGNYSLDYVIEAKNADKKYTVTQNLFIPYTYDFDVISNSFKNNVCAKDSNVMSLKIVNKNSFDDTFIVDFDKLDFMFVNFPLNDSNEIFIPANSSYVLNFKLNPTKNDLGLNDISFFVTEKYSGLTKEFHSNITVDNCYDLDTVFWMPKTKFVCGGDYLTSEFSLMNEGDNDGVIDLVVNGPDFVHFENESFFVSSHSSKNVNLIFDINNNSWEAYPITINAYSRGVLINSYYFYLQLEPKDYCYKLIPRKSAINVRFDKDVFDINLKNIGTREGSYLVDFQSPNNTFTSLNNSIVVDFSKQYLLPINVTSSLIVGETFNSSLTFFEKSSQSVYTYPITITVVNYPIWKRALQSVWNKIYYTNNCLLLSFFLFFLIIIFVLIIIFRSYKKRFFKFPKRLMFVLIIILIILFASIYFFKGFPVIHESYNLESNSTTHILMAEDSPLSINLSNYFFDPDNDIVNYGVSNINDSVLNYSLKNNSLSLLPVKDFNGVTYLKLSATDSFGLSANSKDIRVDVLPVSDYSFKDLYFIFCFYINLFLLFIIFLLLVFICSYKKKSSDYQRTLNEVLVVKSNSSFSKNGSKKSSSSVSSKKNISKNKKSPSSKKSSKKKVSKKKLSKK